jgi:hypothetical protein
MHLEPASDGSSQLRGRVFGDRRRAEALALELRRYFKMRGFEGVSISVAPSDPSGESDPAGRDYSNETSSPVG